MRAKTLIIIAALCALGFLPREIHAANPKMVFMYNLITELPPNYDRIDLHGDLAMSVGPNAIEAGANEEAVYIHFNQSFGNVSIKICNAMGVLVYNTVVNTNVQQTIIIPFSNAASGSYIVELSNATGYAEGDFEHN